MRTVFALTSGRSGTHFFYEIIRRNARECVCRHEPYVRNPSMFGRPIFDYATGNLDAIRKLLQRKARVIAGYAPRTYVETSHAFLKSWFELATEFFSDMKLVHLIRNPLEVARSEANREELTQWLHIPLRNYRGGDGRKYFRWSLTGLEPIFQHFEPSQITLFQRYVVQWIEIENRAMRFLARHNKPADCFTVHSPLDLGNRHSLGSLLEFLELPLRNKELIVAGRKNRNPKKTVVTDEDRRQFAQVVGRLPATYLEIFRSPPYSQFAWSTFLQSPTNPDSIARAKQGC